MSKEERQIYDSNWKAYNDYENTIAYPAFTGAMKKSIGIAKNMMQEYIPLDIICKTTGLPIGAPLNRHHEIIWIVFSAVLLCNQVNQLLVTDFLNWIKSRLQTHGPAVLKIMLYHNDDLSNLLNKLLPIQIIVYNYQTPNKNICLKIDSNIRKYETTSLIQHIPASYINYW